MADVEYNMDDDEAIDFDDFEGDEDGSEESDFSDESETDESEQEDEEEPEELPVEWGIDFSTGELTGEKVTGLEAIKVWAWNVLHIPRYEFEQFTWNCGSELETLIGSVESEEIIRSDVQRMIEECLEQNRYIEGIEDFDCNLDGNTIRASFTIETTFGEVEMDVAV